jgi:hypothetical protein
VVLTFLKALSPGSWYVAGAWSAYLFEKILLVIVLGLKPLRKTTLEEALKKIVGKSSRSQTVHSNGRRYQVSNPHAQILFPNCLSQVDHCFL